MVGSVWWGGGLSYKDSRDSDLLYSKDSIRPNRVKQLLLLTSTKGTIQE